MRKRKYQSYLYDFIRTMSKDEKRYFTQTVKSNSGGRNNLGLRLFKVINDNLNKTNDEIDAEIAFTNNKSKLKSDLYSKLLEASTIYSLEKDAYSKLRLQLNTIGLLYSRALYKPCLKLVNDSINKANKIEANIMLVELYEYKIKLLQYQNLKMEDSNKLTEKNREALRKVEVEFESFKILFDGFSIVKIQSRQTTEHKKVFKKLYKKAIALQNASISFNTHYYINTLIALFHNYQKNSVEYERASKNTFLLFEKNILMKKYRKNQYNTAINNYAVSKFQTKDFQGALTLFEKMDDSGLPFHEKMVVFQYLSSNKLVAHIQSGGIGGLSDFIKWIEKGLETYDKYISDLFKITILSNLSEYFFWTKNYKKAKLYSNKLLNLSSPNLRRDVVRVTKALILIICFETEDLVYLQYLLNSYKSSRKLKNKTLAELWLVRFMEDAIKRVKIDSSFYIEKELDLLKIVLNSQNSNDPIDLSKFNLLVWLRSKTDQQPFKEILLEYNNNEIIDYINMRIKQLI
ncbi:MAG: hypothetical protein J5I47_12315 [Vicingus serpentipes]|nr:hypothetical protein [Vicingus serpentipes]